MQNKIHKIVNYCIAAVWVVNGLFCKVLDFVPRHQEIVWKITHFDRASAGILTLLIGFSEIIMAVWILSRYKSKLNAITQIVVVATMNILEFILVPELLLWGKLNAFFALIFIAIVYFNAFYLNQKQLN